MLPLFRLLLALLRHPLPWLISLLVMAFLALRVEDRLEPKMVPDTPSYRQLAEAQTLERALSSHRTNGYPFFLKSVGHRRDGEFAGSHVRFTYRVFRKIPTVHAVVFLGSILLFWWSVRVYTGSPWLAFFMATPLAYAEIWELVRRVQPDFLAAALALVTISLFILLTTRPRALTWTGLTIALFLTYQVRPAYLFLVALLPLMGPLLRWVAQGETRARLWRFGLGLLIATVLPLLLFCGMRWIVVRDFRLVSFGGHNSIGIAASLLDRDLVKSLDRHRLLAKAILERRESRGMEPIALGSDTRLWHGEHNANVWGIAVPVAHQRVKKRQRRTELPVRAHRIEMNRLLSELSIDIFRRKPLHYLQWVRDSILHCLDRTVAENWIRWPAILIALSVPFGLLARAGPASLSTEPRDVERRRRLLALSVLGFGFFFAHALIVVLVDVPYDRFIGAMHLLLPGVLCGILFELWRPSAVQPAKS